MADYATTDLSIRKTADDYTPELGQEVTWTITVSNDGKSLAENVRVDEMLPEGMEFISNQASAGTFSLNEGLWSIGDLEAGQLATATVTMIVTDIEDYINNYATVSTDTHDYNSSNDQNTIAVDPWQPTNADLSLVKTVSDPQPEVGEIVEWTVTVNNSGPDTAWHTTVSESLPDGLTFVGARASSGAYDFESGVWNVGHLADGESAEMVISARVDSDAAMQYVSTSVAASNTVDDNNANNEAEATITVVEAVEPMPEQALQVSAQEVQAGTSAGIVEGNVFDNDAVGYDGLQDGSVAITELLVDGTTFSAGSGPVQIETAEGGHLEFDFTDGSYVYLAPFVDEDTTETFEYTVTDGSGDPATATLSVTTLPPVATILVSDAPGDDLPVEETEEEIEISLLSDDDDLFASGAMGIVQLPESTDNDWSGTGVYHQDDMYDILSLVV